MKKRLLLISVLSLLLFTAGTSTVYAHPADVYTHNIHLTISKSGLSIKWEIKPGPMLVSYIWYQADTNNDSTVSVDEANQWAATPVSQFTATLGSARIPLKVDSVQFPASVDSFQSGQEFITVNMSAPWPQNTGDSFSLLFHNGMEEAKSVNWYFINVQDGLKFETPQQKNSNLTFKVFQPAAQASTQEQLLTQWDSSKPSLSSWQGGTTSTSTSPNQPDVITQVEQQTIPQLQQSTPQEILTNLVRTQQYSVIFFLFALLVSLALGALHALTPGHGKTVVAAYLVGSRGTTLHAIVLGSIVTLTHTGSVFLLGLVTLAASQYILPTSFIPFLEVVSGLMIVGLGLYLLAQRIQALRKEKARSVEPARKFSLQPMVATAGAVQGKKIAAISTTPEPHQDYAHGHTHTHDHGDGHVHSHEIPESITWRSLIALGISGGLVPCPDAIAILLVAVAINRILLGLALIVSFSLGLAIVLIIIGLLMVNSRRLFERISVFSRFAPVMPIVSAVVVVALGLVLTFGAYTQAKASFVPVGTGTGSAQETRVLYLLEGQDQIKQLYIANVKNGNPTALTSGPNNVVDYALSPDQSRVIYIVQTPDLQNEIWQVDLANRKSSKVTDCTNATCSQPVWSPDGTRVVYEHMSLTGSNATGLPTLWWLDMTTNVAKPVFQEDQLPGGNPRWSPDGKWLSYATTNSVKLYNFDTSETREIKSTLGAAANWSPDNKSILYRDVVIQDNQFVTQLFLYDLATQKATNIIPDPGFENILAAWSPDGSQIAIVRRDLSVVRGDQIWVMNADGSHLRALTNTPDVLHGSLNWSADGKFVLFDLYPLDVFPLESSLQTVDVKSGKVADLNIKGYNPTWAK